MKKFELTKLPPYLILAIKVQCIIYTFFVTWWNRTLQRFNKNNFFVEKNPTIVNFPIKYVICPTSIIWNQGEPLTPAGILTWPNSSQMILKFKMHTLTLCTI